MTLTESFSLKGGIVEKALFECFEFLLLRLGLDCDEKQQNACLRFFVGVPCIVHGTASTDFSKFFFKTRFHGTIYIFKNYFVTVFSVFNFLFLTISGIQTNSNLDFRLLNTASFERFEFLP